MALRGFSPPKLLGHGGVPDSPGTEANLHHNWLMQVDELQPIPSSLCKFLVKWHDPYTMVEKSCPIP